MTLGTLRRERGGKHCLHHPCHGSKTKGRAGFGTRLARSTGAAAATAARRPDTVRSRGPDGRVIQQFLDSLFTFAKRRETWKSEPSEVIVTEIETPKPTEPDANPLIEDPQQTPPHVPELPPVRDPDPQKERTRR